MSTWKLKPNLATIVRRVDGLLAVLGLAYRLGLYHGSSDGGCMDDIHSCRFGICYPKQVL